MVERTGIVGMGSSEGRAGSAIGECMPITDRKRLSSGVKGGGGTLLASRRDGRIDRSRLACL
jgi:hypothetical protein